MFKNRFILILAALSMLLVTLAVSQPFSKPPKTVDLSQPPRPVVVPVTGPEETSHISWIQPPDPTLPGDKPCKRVTQLIQGPGHTSPGERPLKKRNSMHLIPGRVPTLPGERRWKPQGNWASSGACPTTSQENIFAGIHNNLDSATRSYIAWGLALQAKNDIGVLVSLTALP